MCVCVCVHKYTYYIYIYICIYIYIYYIYTYTYTYIYKCICILHVYIHVTCIRLYIYTHTLSAFASQDSAATLKTARVDMLTEKERFAFFLNVYHTMIQHAYMLLGPPASNIKVCKHRPFV